jgi:hypothetical protein
VPQIKNRRLTWRNSASFGVLSRGAASCERAKGSDWNAWTTWAMSGSSDIAPTDDLGLDLADLPAASVRRRQPRSQRRTGEDGSLSSSRDDCRCGDSCKPSTARLNPAHADLLIERLKLRRPDAEKTREMPANRPLCAEPEASCSRHRAIARSTGRPTSRSMWYTARPFGRRQLRSRYGIDSVLPLGTVATRAVVSIIRIVGYNANGHTRSFGQMGRLLQEGWYLQER